MFICIIHNLIRRILQKELRFSNIINLYIHIPVAQPLTGLKLICISQYFSAIQNFLNFFLI